MTQRYCVFQPVVEEPLYGSSSSRQSTELARPTARTRKFDILGYLTVIDMYDTGIGTMQADALDLGLQR